jgi:hypothetical protein
MLKIKGILKSLILLLCTYNCAEIRDFCSEIGRPLAISVGTKVYQFSVKSVFDEGKNLAGDESSLVRACSVQYSNGDKLKIAIKRVYCSDRTIKEIQYLKEFSGKEIFVNYYGCRWEEFTMEIKNEQTGVIENKNYAYIYIVQELFYSDMSTAHAREIIHEWPKIKLHKEISKLFKALNFLKNKGLAHLDYKPGNIMLTNRDNGEFRIIDFGVSDLIGNTNKLHGTPHYASQDKYTSNEITEQFDIFSLALTIPSILAGEAEVFHKSTSINSKNQLEYQYLEKECFTTNYKIDCFKQIFLNSRAIFKRFLFEDYDYSSRADPSKWNMATFLLHIIGSKNLNLTSEDCVAIIDNIISVENKSKETKSAKILKVKIDHRNYLQINKWLNLGSMGATGQEVNNNSHSDLKKLTIFDGKIVQDYKNQIVEKQNPNSLLEVSPDLSKSQKHESPVYLRIPDKTYRTTSNRSAQNAGLKTHNSFREDSRSEDSRSKTPKFNETIEIQQNLARYDSKVIGEQSLSQNTFHEEHKNSLSSKSSFRKTPTFLQTIKPFKEKSTDDGSTKSPTIKKSTRGALKSDKETQKTSELSTTFYELIPDSKNPGSKALSKKFLGKYEKKSFPTKPELVKNPFSSNSDEEKKDANGVHSDYLENSFQNWRTEIRNNQFEKKPSIHRTRLTPNKYLTI